MQDSTVKEGIDFGEFQKLSAVELLIHHIK